MFAKTTKYFLLPMIVLVAAVSLFGWVNTSVSLNYAREQQKTEQERSELLRTFVLTLNRGTSRSEILRLANDNFRKEHIVKEDQNGIVVDDLVFQFDRSQSLVGVRFLSASNH